MNKAYIFYGVSASGKSRYAKRLLEELRENNSIAVYINRGTTRREVLGL